MESDLEDFFDQLVTAQGQPGTEHTLLATVIALALSSILGFLLSLAYFYTYTGKRDRRGQMVYTIILLCLGGALVWLIVANNLVRAFGLAGALAMIRYRTRMTDPKDTTMVFFAIIVGMACGLHQYVIAAIGAAFITLVLWVIKLVDMYTHVGQPTSNGRNQINGPGEFIDGNGFNGSDSGENGD